jgi:hypothetical protein
LTNEENALAQLEKARKRNHWQSFNCQVTYRFSYASRRQHAYASCQHGSFVGNNITKDVACDNGVELLQTKGSGCQIAKQRVGR